MLSIVPALFPFYLQTLNVVDSLVTHSQYESQMLLHATCGNVNWPWAVCLGEWPSDFIEVYCSVWVLLVLWSRSPGLNFIHCGMPLVEKSSLVFAINDKYIQVCMVLKKAQHSRNKKMSNAGGEWRAARLVELLGDFMGLLTSVGTSLVLWPCSLGSNLIYCRMPSVEKWDVQYIIICYIIYRK